MDGQCALSRISRTTLSQRAVLVDFAKAGLVKGLQPTKAQMVDALRQHGAINDTSFYGVNTCQYLIIFTESTGKLRYMRAIV
jgi:hypothetical protein